MTTLRQFDTGLMALIVAVLVTTVGIYLWDSHYFSQTYAAEDNLVEYATAVFLFVASLVLFSNARSLFGKSMRGAAVLTVFYGLLFFFAAGEEISWGQRIFSWETGETFQEINKQGETNLHNLLVKTPWGEFHLAKTLFGPVLTLILLLYLVVLPLVYPRSERIRRLADRFAVPVPGKRHAFFALAASLVIAAIDVSRKWEVYELVFSLIATSIFLLPVNRDKTA
ncbi:MAG: hypothetical protein NXH84_17865 [Rhodobacteraceae bacterium]|nr:hypothetical protein [Paracoccaceae bacterium]